VNLRDFLQFGHRCGILRVWDFRQMNTKHVADRDERKKLKRAARKEAPAYTGRAKGEDRGSLKRKVKKVVKGTRKR
jgi:hypothetical protein